MKSPASTSTLLLTLLRLWLTGFLGIVGFMKAAGLLRHPLSRLAGAVEGTGALLQLPLILSDGPGGIFASHAPHPSSLAFRASVMGALLFLAALGLILSTYKRKGPVCWTQAALSVAYLALFSAEAAAKKAKQSQSKDGSGLLSSVTMMNPTVLAALGVLVAFAGATAGVRIQEADPGGAW